MYLKNSWQVAGFDDELEKPFVARRIMAEPVLIFRSGDRLAAIEDLCPHRLVPLSAGFRQGDEIVCGYHGLRFGFDGACRGMPGRARIPSSAKVRTYPVELRWGMVWIWMGDPALADPALIPDLHWLDSPDWASVRGMIPIAADYRLINDNLLDLSHESYVHAATIANGNGEEMGHFPMDITVAEGNVICAERVMHDVAAPPGLVDILKVGNRIDREQRAIFLAPSVNLSDSRMSSREPGSNRGARNRILHLLTPASSGQTHYFYIGSRDYALNDPDMDAIYARLVDKALGEDRAMLETQQRSLAELDWPTVPRVAWSVDEAAVKGRRLLDALIADEASDPKALTRPGKITGLTEMTRSRD